MTEYVLGEVPVDVAPRKKVKLQMVKVPEFVSKSPVKATDKPYTMQDALRQARTIEDVWREAGHDVQVDIIREVRGNATSYRLRMPNLVNGLPVKREDN